MVLLYFQITGICFCFFVVFFLLHLLGDKFVVEWRDVYVLEHNHHRLSCEFHWLVILIPSLLTAPMWFINVTGTL